MSWNPDRNFRLDLGYVDADDFNTTIRELPYYDLTHLIMWTQGLKHLQAYISGHAEQLFQDKVGPVLYWNILSEPWIGIAEPALKARFKSDAVASIAPALDKLHLTTANYVSNRNGKVDETLKNEREGRLQSAEILKQDITDANVKSVMDAHPHADYKGRVQWILSNLEAVKDSLHDDYNYWQGILKLVGG